MLMSLLGWSLKLSVFLIKKLAKTFSRVFFFKMLL